MSIFGPRGVPREVLAEASASVARMRESMDKVSGRNSLTYLEGSFGLTREVDALSDSLQRLVGRRDYGPMAEAMFEDLGPLAWSAGAMREATQIDATWIQQMVTRHLDRLDASIAATEKTRPWWSPEAPPSLAAIDAVDGVRALGPAPASVDELRPALADSLGIRSSQLRNAYDAGSFRGIVQRRELPMLLNEHGEAMFDRVVAELGSGAKLVDGEAALATLWPDELASRAARTLDGAGAARVAASLLDHTSGSPTAMRDLLVRLRDRVGTGDGSQTAVDELRARTVELIDRNIARIERTDAGPVRGYSNYPDLAEIGAIKSNVQLLDRLGAGRLKDAGGPEVLSW